MSVEQFENEVVELAIRRVRTPEGAQFYGLPIGAPITADVIAAKQAEASAAGKTPPKGALSSGKNGGGAPGTIAAQKAAEKQAPKAAPKLNIKVKKPTLSGNKHFSVGKSKYTAPNGSKLIRPSSQPGMAYIVTPEGGVHAFNEAGEIEIPATLKAVFQNKFSADFEGDENYSIEEFEATSGASDMKSLKVGALLLDKNGTPQFKKLAADSWEHTELGVKLKDDDLQTMYDDGELVPDTSDEDVATAEEAFANTAATNFKEMTSQEATDTLDGMKPGQTVKIDSGNQVTTFTKQEEGGWLADGKKADGSDWEPIPSDTLSVMRDFLSIGKDPEPEFNPLDGTTKDPLDGSASDKPGVGVGDSPNEAWIASVQPGAQMTYTSAAGNKTAWTKTDDGWLSDKNDTLSDDIMASLLGSQAANLKITKQSKPAPAPDASEQDAPAPESPAPTREAEAPALAAAKRLRQAGSDGAPAAQKSKANSSELAWEEGMEPLNLLSDDSPDYVWPGDYEYASEAAEDDILNAQPGDKILVGYDPDFEPDYDGENTGLPNYEPWDLVEKQPDGSWKSLASDDMEYTEDDLVMWTEPDFEGAADGAQQLFAFKGNSSKTGKKADAPAEAPETDDDSENEALTPEQTALKKARDEYDTALAEFAQAQKNKWGTSVGAKATLEDREKKLYKAMRDAGVLPTKEEADKAHKAATDELGKAQKAVAQTPNGTPERTAAEKKSAEAQEKFREAFLTKNAVDWAESEKAKTPAEQPSAEQPSVEETEPPTHTLLNDPDAKQIGGQAGSNAGGLYELPMSDGTKQRFYVKKAQSADHGNNESLANALYRELGVKAPEFDHAEDGNLYSKIVDGEQDMNSRLSDAEWLDKVRRDFAIDAFLSNRDVFGLTYDNILTDADGNPWRIDNGGALRYRAMGEKKTDFDAEVSELEVFRKGKKAKVFGPEMTQEQELDGAKRIQALTPERIQEMVSEYGMDQDMADTLIARRKKILETYNLSDETEADAPAADATEAPAADVTPELSEKQAELKPEAGELIDPKAPPETQTGDQVWEITPNGNVLVSTKQSDGNWVTAFSDGEEIASGESDVFAGPEKNRFFLVKADAAAAPDADEGSIPDGVPADAEKVTPSDVNPVTKAGDKIYEVTPGGKVIVSTKHGDDDWLTELPSGLKVQTIDSEVFSEGVPVYLHSSSEAGASDDAPETAWEWDEGHTITSVADLDSLPVNTMLAYQKKDGSKTFYTKLENGSFLTPGGNVYAPSQLSGSAKSGKFQVHKMPSAAPAPQSDDYADGDIITRMGHVNGFPAGQRLEIVNSGTGNHVQFIEKTDEGWVAAENGLFGDEGIPILPDTLGNLVKQDFLKYVETPQTEAPSATKDKQLWQGAPAISDQEITDAYQALEAHSSFQVAYGLKSLPDSHPLKNAENQDALKTAALNAHPDLKAKPAVVQYLKDILGIESGNETEDADAPKVSLGSKDPKSTGVQGMDGGEFSTTEIQQAIDILEAYPGKLFKAELNKKGSPLGTLNPNSLVGFDKDKTVVKQKFIDLLKAKLVRTEENIKHPKIKSVEEFDGLQVGTEISYLTPNGDKFNYIKTNDSQWAWTGHGHEEPIVLESSLFHNYVEQGRVRIEKQPDPLPDYAKTPDSIKDKEVSEEDVENFGPGDLDSAPVGTELEGTNSNDMKLVFQKQPNGDWHDILPSGEHYSTLGTGLIAKKWDEWGLKLKQKDGPSFNPNATDGIVPGKYTTENGTAYMVVHADGSGVYVNTKGGVSKLTKNAVKKNFDSGMSSYHGMPENIPAPDGKKIPATKKPTAVGNLADGTYFAGSPTNAKTAVYEISGDTATVYKPNTTLAGLSGTKIGSSPSQTWEEHAGVGAAYTTALYSVSGGGYIGQGTWTKGDDGLWHAKLNSGLTEGLPEPTATPPSGYHSKVTSHGLSAPVELQKAKANTLFSQGKLTDQYGNSVVPEGYSGAVYLFGASTTIPALAAAKKFLDSVEPDNLGSLAAQLKSLGVFYDMDLWKKYRADNGFEALGNQQVIDSMKKAVDDMLDGVDTDIPESDASALFEWNDMGQAKLPVSVVAMNYNAYDKNSMGEYIKAASAAIGNGKVIGQHLTKMNKWERQSWISYFKQGNFKAIYEIEVKAAASENKAHVSGYMHPGYSGNEATNQIIWGPVVEGEISANETVEGNWTSATITPSMAEVDNYLIKAQMQNPTFLTLQEKRSWYANHKANHKDSTDQLSALALQRKLNGEQPLSDAPTWTDDVQPAKAYDTIFENDPTPWPSSEKWSASSYEATTEWATDNINDPDFKAFYEQEHSDWNFVVGSTDYSQKYKTEAVVAAYFGKKRAEYEEELLKPVYSLDTQIAKGHHEVWTASDQFGRKYVWKPADSEAYLKRLKAEAAANNFSRSLGFNTPAATLTEVDGKQGVMQAMVDNVGTLAVGDKQYVQMSTLNEKQLGSIASEHVLDWLLDNDDNHPDNMLLQQDGSIVGIDKGRTFVAYGNWPGLAGDDAAHTNLSDRSEHQTLTQTLLYDDIRAGKLSKEQVEAAYFAARKAALRIQNAPDAMVESFVRNATEGRTNWDAPEYMAAHFKGKPPQNADELVAAVLARKNSMAEQIDGMWAKIYKDAGLGDLPEAPPKVFDSHISGWDEPDVIEAASEAKVWGAAPLHASAAIVNGSSLLWTEKDENGAELHKGKMTLGQLTQDKLVAFLQPKAQQVQIGQQAQNHYLTPGVEFPNTNTMKSSITAAAKNVTKNSATKEYDADILATFKETQSTLEKDALHWSPNLQPEGGLDYVEFPSGMRVSPDYLPQYKLMLDHYNTMVGKVNAAIDSGGTTEKSEFTLFQALAPKTDGIILTNPAGTTFTQLANGQWLDSEGALWSKMQDVPDPLNPPDGWTANTEPSAAQAPQVLYTTQTAAGKTGALNEGGEKIENSKAEGTAGHTGKEYRITLPTGEVITFRNAMSTDTQRSQQGTLSFKLAGDDKQASLARVQQQLETMGLDMAGADETTAELSYWRAMFGRVLASTAAQDGPAGVKKARAKLLEKTNTVKGPNGETLSHHNIIEGIGLSMTPGEEQEFWRGLASEAWGKEKVDAWIAGEKFMPKFQHMDLSDPTKNTGIPYYDRIDVDVEELQKKGHMLAIGNNGKDDSLLKYITSGGMVSTEERLRILGHFKQGASSGSDQGTGGANSVFTRIAHTGSNAEFSGSIYGKHVAYWNPAAMAQVGTYSFSGDQFGNLSLQESGNKYDPKKALDQYTGTGNETMVSNALSIFDYLEIMVFENAAKRNEAIQRMKALGFDMLRGLPIEDRLVMRANLAEAMKKVKAQWTK